MKNIFIITVALMVHISFGQTEKTSNKVVTENFIKNYNNEDYQAIFLMFAAVMKEALPLEKTTEFLKGLKAQAGNITNREFVNYENSTYASYKTTFERAVLSLHISINDTSQVTGLLIKPFVEKMNTKNVIHNLSFKNSSITKEQSEIIVEKTKIFPNNTQLSMAIINPGKAHFYGIKKENDTISTIDNQNSIFEIGSITKVFTATLLAKAIRDGKVKLNDPINTYLKVPFKNNTEISFLDLANHTSGLPSLPSNLDLNTVNPENPYKEYQEKELEEYLVKHLKLANKGTYQYSNLGAGLLGYTLSKMGNVPFETLLQETIFSKYDMENSSSEITKIKGNLVKGLNPEGKEVPNWEFSVLAGAGALFSTVADLSKFAISQFNDSNKELSLTREKTYTINQAMDIGLGWHLLTSKSEHIWYWHNGGTGGYTSSMVIDEKSNNGIIILSNVSGFHPNMGNIDQLSFELMKTLKKE